MFIKREQNHCRLFSPLETCVNGLSSVDELLSGQKVSNECHQNVSPWTPPAHVMAFM